MSTLRALSSIDDCQQQIKRAFQKSPEEFEVTARDVEQFFKCLPKTTSIASKEQVAALRSKIVEYKFLKTLQKLSADHAQGKNISKGLIDLRYNGLSDLYFDNSSLVEPMARKFLKLAEKTGHIKDIKELPLFSVETLLCGLERNLLKT